MKDVTSKIQERDQRIRTTIFLDNYGAVYIYSFAFLSLIFSTLFEMHWIIIIPIVVFLIYDIWFRWIRIGYWSEFGRTYNGTVESIRAASQYTSFFIAFIAISLSLAVKNEITTGLESLFDEIIIRCFGFIVLSFSGLVLLFIPIPYLVKGEKKEPSNALKNCFFIVLFMEKTIILILIYLIIQIFKIYIN
ncbi:MAG: hypothetical protein PHS59_09890 [Paludibacter sp.]|nr:hypothetical protein [Paludibacter sp.]